MRNLKCHDTTFNYIDHLGKVVHIYTIRNLLFRASALTFLNCSLRQRVRNDRVVSPVPVNTQ